MRKRQADKSFYQRTTFVAKEKKRKKFVLEDRKQPQTMTDSEGKENSYPIV